MVPGHPVRQYAPGMPAPLGKTPTRKMPDIQVFGREDSSDTRASKSMMGEPTPMRSNVGMKSSAYLIAESERQARAGVIRRAGGILYHQAWPDAPLLGDGEVRRQQRLIVDLDQD